MHSIKNKINKAYRGVAEKIMGDMTESAFLSKGMLTPEEFVIAGDSLVAKCPTWSWEAGVEGKTLKSLPEEKQFLLIRDVPCKIRAKDLMDEEKNHIDENEGEDGWIIAEPKEKQEIVEIDKEDKGEVEGNDEVVDIEDELDSSEEEGDQNIFAKKEEPKEEEKKGEEENEVVKCRRYNISLTYDKYYATPRLWLQGYDENKVPLDKQMFDDVMAEHAKKTVTIEKHPHLDGPKQATIHPCEHANVMKKMIDIMSSNGKEPTVDQYMFIFLKFLSSVIPTIQYDYTTDIEL